MKEIKFQSWKIFIANYMSVDEAKSAFSRIQNSEFKEMAILKNTMRSSVRRIKLDDQELIFKTPIEKNKRLWIRFLSLFRSSEAFKNIKGMCLLQQIDVPSTLPIMAAEKRVMGVAVDSWLLYEYLDGKSCLNLKSSYPDVVKTLSDMHSKGYLHGDPQVQNFVSRDERIYVIDSIPRRARNFGFNRAYEWIYLRKSAPEIEAYFGSIKNSFQYKFASWYDKLDRFRARTKDKIRGATR